jgi:predicted methyltransferase
MIRRFQLRFLLLALLTCNVWAQDIANEPRREKWQRVPDLFAAIGVREGAVIADVGAGEGFLTVRLAAAVGPTGKVYAVDKIESIAAGLRERLVTTKLANVEVIVGSDADPRLPIGTLDGAIIVNAYHEMPPAILRYIYAALKPGGRLVLCEPTPSASGRSRNGQIDDHVLVPELIVGDLRAVGFAIIRQENQFATNLAGNHYSLVVAERPSQ